MAVANAELDLDGCAREPIHVPGGVQPHGALLVLDPNALHVVQASENASAVLGRGSDEVLSLPLAAVGVDVEREVRNWLKREEPTFIRTVEMNGRRLQVLGHRTQQGVILEFEEGPAHERETLEGLYPQLLAFIEAAQAASTVPALCEAAARQFRTLIGCNRVIVYRFDRSWNGEVIAEDRDDALPSYLGLHFPASDIPAQARALYRTNRLRVIPDSEYRSVPLRPPLCPTDGAPLDLSQAALRSVSPVHLQYMRNMGTRASMSISLLIEGELWGLISCHHGAALRIKAQVRTACDLLGKVVSLQIGALTRASYAARRIELKRRETMLLARLAEAASLRAGLSENADQWLALADAGGAALVDEEGVFTVGAAPSEAAIRALAARLQAQHVLDHYVTDALPSEQPEFAPHADVASGVFAMSISQIHPRYIMWFRPEVLRTVNWGGDPRKPAEAGGELHPRRSFEVWRQQVSGRSPPWGSEEVDSLIELRNSIISVVLRRAEERAELTTQLQRSNRELESFSYSVSHDLRAPFRHIVGYTQLLRDREKNLSGLSQHYLDAINEAAANAGQLVDDLLSFSQLGRATLVMSPVDMRKVVQEVRRSLEPDLHDRQIEWRIGELPPAQGDAALLRQVFLNLLENAVKYSRGRTPAVIEVRGEARSAECVYCVSDNGAGFDMAYVDKLFGVFQRLHRMEDYEGTGIGLALTKRIIERHGGWIRAQAALDQGATFEFALPCRTEHSRHG